MNMTLQTKKRNYLKPAMQVFELQQQGCLMNSGARQSYGIANDGVDPSELENGIWIWN